MTHCDSSLTGEIETIAVPCRIESNTLGVCLSAGILRCVSDVRAVQDAMSPHSQDDSSEN